MQKFSCKKIIVVFKYKSNNSNKITINKKSADDSICMDLHIYLALSHIFVHMIYHITVYQLTSNKYKRFRAGARLMRAELWTSPIISQNLILKNVKPAAIF